MIPEIGKQYRVREAGIARVIVGSEIVTVTALHSTRLHDRKLFVRVQESRALVAAELLEPLD